jgi:hypothetical protein
MESILDSVYHVGKDFPRKLFRAPLTKLLNRFPVDAYGRSTQHTTTVQITSRLRSCRGVSCNLCVDAFDAIASTDRSIHELYADLQASFDLVPRSVACPTTSHRCPIHFQRGNADPWEIPGDVCTGSGGETPASPLLSPRAVILGNASLPCHSLLTTHTTTKHSTPTQPVFPARPVPPSHPIRPPSHSEVIASSIHPVDLPLIRRLPPRLTHKRKHHSSRTSVQRYMASDSLHPSNDGDHPLPPSFSNRPTSSSNTVAITSSLPHLLPDPSTSAVMGPGGGGGGGVSSTCLEWGPGGSCACHAGHIPIVLCMYIASAVSYATGQTGTFCVSGREAGSVSLSVCLWCMCMCVCVCVYVCVYVSAVRPSCWMTVYT